MPNITTLPQLLLAGIKVRTKNTNEISQTTWKIKPTIDRFLQEQISKMIIDRLASQKVYCCYTNYESDFNGEYDFFIGHEVASLENLPEGIEGLSVTAATYSVITAGPGSMPHIVIQAWQKIWAMSPQELGGERTYVTDFEVYDEQASNGDQSIVKIFIGIKS